MRAVARTKGAASRPSPPNRATKPGSRTYERTFRTSVCRGTVNGSVPLHSTTVRSPNGKRTVRVVAPKRDGTRRPALHATWSWVMTRLIVSCVPRLVPIPLVA